MDPAGPDPTLSSDPRCHVSGRRRLPPSRLAPAPAPRTPRRRARLPQDKKPNDAFGPRAISNRGPDRICLKCAHIGLVTPFRVSTRVEKKQASWLRVLPRILESMAGSQNLLTPGPADGLAVGRQGPRSRLCLRTRCLPALTRPPTLAGRPLRERGPAMQDGLDDCQRLRPRR